MKRKDYPPAVSLTPVLINIINNRLPTLQRTITFPESVQKLKTKLNNYFENLRDKTPLKPTDTSELPPRRENFGTPILCLV